MRKRIGLLIVAALLVATTVSAMSSGPAWACGGPCPPPCPEGIPGNPQPLLNDDQQRICHRTGSETNPYVLVQPSDNAAGHNENHNDQPAGAPDDICIESCP
jgi:hypothetical protein